MRIGDVVSLFKEYAVLGLMAIVLCGVLFFVGYKVVYQKMMKGTKTISKRKMVLYGITVLYVVVVLGAVFLNRGNIYGNANFDLFSSYKEAYHKMEISLFRNIVLNMLLFVPFGFLLPFYSQKFQKVYRVVLIGLLSSVLIETLQYVTKTGIFEIDDILNNTMGMLIGCCFWKIGYCVYKKEKYQFILGYILPMVVVILGFFGMYIVYQNQELGNLPFEYNAKVNMKSVQLENKGKLSKTRQLKDIYYITSLTEEQTRKKADMLFSKLGTKTEEKDIYENTAIYYSQDRKYSIWIEFQDGSYSYTDYSHFGKENLKKKSKASKEEVQQALEKLGVVIPNDAIFKEEENGYRFLVPMQIQENTIQNGDITCSYCEDGSIQKMNNNCITYDKVKEKQIISEQEAYEEIVKGRFQYDEHFMGKLETMVVEDVKLSYELDTKGYYVPIYVFQVNINGQPQNIEIKAVAKEPKEVDLIAGETTGELEIISYQGTFYAKGVVVRPEAEKLTIMPTVSNEEYRHEEKFYYENMQVTNLKQGQEVKIRFHYRNVGGDYLHEPVIEKVEIIKEKSETQIPRDILVKAYSSEDKVSVAISQEKSNTEKLEATITDSNELKYDYSLMEYHIYRYNPPPTKTEITYTDEGASVAEYDPWPEATKIGNVSTQNQYTISPNGELPITLNWKEVYGKLKEGKYKLTLATVSAKRQSILNPNLSDYPCDGIVIDMEFTIDKNDKITYGEIKVR